MVALTGAIEMPVTPLVDELMVSAAVPVTPFHCALMLVVPALKPLVMPALVTVAMAGAEEVQLTVLEMSAMVPSE